MVNNVDTDLFIADLEGKQCGHWPVENWPREWAVLALTCWKLTSSASSEALRLPQRAGAGGHTEVSHWSCLNLSASSLSVLARARLSLRPSFRRLSASMRRPPDIRVISEMVSRSVTDANLLHQLVTQVLLCSKVWGRTGTKDYYAYVISNNLYTYIPQSLQPGNHSYTSTGICIMYLATWSYTLIRNVHVYLQANLKH